LGHAVILFGMSNVTRILSQIEQGDPQAAEQLLPLVYNELRKLVLSPGKEFRALHGSCRFEEAC